MPKLKKIAVVSELHCGHPKGLTPPEWWWKTSGGPDDYHERCGEVQAEMWQRYREIIKAESPIDVLAVGGDTIHGRTGDEPMITLDREEQSEMAISCLRQWRAKSVVMVRGTPYHTGSLEKYERRIAKEFDAEIAGKLFFHAKGTRVPFFMKHKVGRSRIPHGKATPVVRQAVWNQLLAAREREPRARVYLFGHVHYHLTYSEPGWVAMTLPALCCRTEFSDEQSEGESHWGIVIFEVEGDQFDWHSHIVEIVSDVPRELEV